MSTIPLHFLVESVTGHSDTRVGLAGEQDAGGGARASLGDTGGGARASLGTFPLVPRRELGGAGTKLGLRLPQVSWGFSAPLAQGSGVSGKSPLPLS